MPARFRVWIATDDAAVSEGLRSALADSTFRARLLSDSSHLVTALTQEVPDALILQVTHHPARRQSAIQEIHARWPKLPIIAITTSDLDSAVTAFHDGAFDCLATPFVGSEVNRLVTRACDHARALIAQGTASPPKMGSDLSSEIIGHSPPMREIFRAVARLAPHDMPVIIAGEPGSGKELIARALHRYGQRCSHAFVAARLTGLSSAEIDRGLFGEGSDGEPGNAGPGSGLIAAAIHGTLFLDQITELSRGTQTRLLQLVGESRYRSAEEGNAANIDLRLIGSVTTDPRNAAATEARNSLAELLGAIVITVPPLRDRREDVPLLLAHHLSEAAHELDMAPRRLSSDAVAALCDLDWPGNVGQLATLCRWITAMSPTVEVGIADLPNELWTLPERVQSHLEPIVTRTWEDSLGLWVDDRLRRGEVGLAKRAFDSVENVLITAALRYTRGHRQDAARLLGVGRNTLTRKMNKSTRNGRGIHKA
ncbi:sigma 54-interacting transcriptional regulator [Methylotetracoccus oryzae]|uniref:sigma 54-interacting transcriptional regulator n=1 Tax=Methylotetracoccus oryzae TaxID=1919059 RepID=UPI00111AACC6|nr:sigma 54-interacting transcriptional regulator [Methylotetracoccus oryzae]